MPAFFFAFLFAALVSLAGREQLRAARLAQARGDPIVIFAVGALSIGLTTALAAWLGAAMIPLMEVPARRMFVAFMLGFAAFEVTLLRAPRTPAEPTRSVGALAIVLLGAHVTDAARFGVLALVVATGQPVLAAAGGIAGSLAPLGLAVVAGQHWEQRIPVRTIALATGGALLLAALIIGFWARGVAL